MPIYLYTLLIDEEFYDIPLTDIPITNDNTNCMSFILSAINKIKII